MSSGGDGYAGSRALSCGCGRIAGLLLLGDGDLGGRSRVRQPLPLPHGDRSLGGRSRFGGPFSFLFLSLEEDGGFFLAGAVARASTSFSDTGMGTTAATSAMDARAASIAESSRSKFHDTEDDAAADVEFCTKNFQDYLSRRIRGHMHRVLNIDENKN